MKTPEGHYQVGVVSWGFGCGRLSYSGVYSRVSGAIDWITQQICQLSTNPPPSCSTITEAGNAVNENGWEEDKETVSP
jgi:secreted trypsin-like serine protease